MNGFLLRVFLLCGCFLLQGVAPMAAQRQMRFPAPDSQMQRDSLQWERVLQRYQSFCDMAVAAKAGDKEAAKRLRPQADSIGMLLKNVKGSNMTPSQQQRFNQMKSRYANVVTLPEVPQIATTPAPSAVQVVSGQTIVIRDTVIVMREVQTIDTVRIVEQKVVEVPVERTVVYPVKVPAEASIDVPESTQAPSFHYLLLAEAVVPDSSYGLMAGVMCKAGLYARFDSNFIFPTIDYTCTSDGQASYGQIWTTGKTVRSRLSTAAGVLWHPASWLTLYTGAGYGWRTLCWEDVSGRWAEVSDVSFRGVSGDFGVVLNVDHLALSAGINTIAFRRIDCTLGIGIYF